MDRGGKIAFLQASLDTQRRYKEHLDQKASILLGISGVIFVLSVNHLDKVGFIFIALFSLISSLLNVWVISFPFRKINKDKFGLICYLGFYRMSFNEYYNNIKDVLRSEDQMIGEFAKEIYSLAEFSIKFKIRLIRYSSLILSIGLILGLIFIFII